MGGTGACGLLPRTATGTGAGAATGAGGSATRGLLSSLRGTARLGPLAWRGSVIRGLLASLRGGAVGPALPSTIGAGAATRGPSAIGGTMRAPLS